MKNNSGHTKTQCCPICKTEGAFVRNVKLERQLAQISQPCENEKHGCTYKLFPWDQTAPEEHRENCMNSVQKSKKKNLWNNSCSINLFHCSIVPLFHKQLIYIFFF